MSAPWSRRLVIVLIGVGILSLGYVRAEPLISPIKVLLYADFEKAEQPIAYSAGKAVMANNSLQGACPGIWGKGIKLEDGKVVFDLSKFGLRNEGAISFAYRRLKMHGNPDFGEGPSFLTLNDMSGKTMFEVNVSGHVTTPNLAPGRQWRWGGG